MWEEVNEFCLDGKAINFGGLLPRLKGNNSFVTSICIS
jgi:hypothetical protein